MAFASAADASPTASVTIVPAPEDQGDAFVPGTRAITDLHQAYVEEEYLVSGAADLFNYANDPPLGPDDIVVAEEDIPFTTRMIVRRPVDPDQFHGTVVIEWWNSTAGFDTAPAWDVSAEYFARRGVVYVGVTNSTTALGFLTGGCSVFGVLPPSCGTRYAMLDLPENGLAFEMMSQIANALKSNSSASPLPEEFEVERLYHAGQSQQGGSVITYASAFHFHQNDGYFVQQAGSARSLNRDSTTLPACGAGAPAFPGCTPLLQGDDRLVRTDLPVPVVHAITETDIQILFGTVGRQPDTPTFRYYEIAGGSHLTVHKDTEVVPAGLIGPDPILLEDLCQFPINSTADGPVFFSHVVNALWVNLERQVKWGVRPPAGRQMDVVDGVVQRDEFGNGMGGIRLPSMEVPIATYTPGNFGDPNLPPFLQNIGNLACFLASSVEEFDEDTLDALYPNHLTYLSKVTKAAVRLKKQRFLLDAELFQTIAAASRSRIGCGLGFELSLLLPPLFWLRGKRRDARGCRSS